MAEKRPGLVVQAEKGRLDGLKALRSKLGAAIEADDGRQVAALAARFQSVLREIDELERAAGRKGSLVDELADRRKAGKPDAPGGAASGRRGKNVGA